MELDIFIIILIIILIIGISICLNADTLGYKEVLGGAIITNILSDNTSDNVPNEDQNNKQTEKLPISDKEPIYVDGLNLLYSYPHR